MADMNDLLVFVPGSKVIVTGCEAREHGANEGCVCSLKGFPLTMGKRYETCFAGTPTWHMVGTDKRVRLSEITFLREES